ncbi:C-type lectin-like [Trinorchestia longiramus]|nr:C-type lectin-like [Trinorchestia longiramus]
MLAVSRTRSLTLISVVIIWTLPSLDSSSALPNAEFERVWETCPESAFATHSVNSKLLCAGSCKAVQKCSAFCFSKAQNFCQLNDALQHCQDMGFFLALPQNENENNFLKEMNPLGLWLGADVIGHNGFYTSGSPPQGDRQVLYSSWGSGEPNNPDTEQCALQLDKGTWNDMACSSAQTFVCQFPFSGACSALPISATPDLTCYRRSQLRHFPNN